MEVIVRGPVQIAINEPSQIAEARRTAVELAGDLGLVETPSGKLAIIVTEAATNVLRHAKGGELIFSSVRDGSRAGIEMLAIDRGPGMADVARCFADGYSTVAGSPGEGLGAIARLASEHDIYSRPDGGTVLMARVFGGPLPSTTAEVGGIAAPYFGERACGDAWASAARPQGRRVIIADGLGHGTGAAEASERAVEIFNAELTLSLDLVIEHLHLALKRTRGAALAIADIDYRGHTLTFCGVGNISASIKSTGSSQSLVSINGTVGASMRKVQTFTYDFPPNAALVMHSDGLNTHWTLSAYPGLLARSPSVVAGVLYRDHRRLKTDDATVVVIKDRQAA